MSKSPGSIAVVVELWPTKVGRFGPKSDPWLYPGPNRPTLTSHSSTTTAIDPGDLDMVERESRALPDEVRTCRWSGLYVQLGRVKVRNTNSATTASPLQVTPRICRWCMCVSRHVGNLRWLVLAVET